MKNPVGTRRQQQKQETKELILKTAMFQFEKKGFGKTTIRDIASEAGIAVGTIFSHFQDKVALLCEILFDALEQEIENARKSLPANLPIYDQFNHFARQFYGFWLQRTDLAKSFFVEYTFANSSATQRFEKQIEVFLKSFVDQLEALKQQGQVKNDTDCGMVAASFWAHYVMVLVFELKYPQPSLERMLATLKQMNRMTIEGILT